MSAKEVFENIGALEAAREGVREAVKAFAPGLEGSGGQMWAELKRLGTQGSMEAASALFNGSSFVPYGPGQYTPSKDGQEQNGQAGQEMERGGMER